MSDWVSGRASDSHARGREFESLRWLLPFLDSVGGILEEGSPHEVACQYRCLPNQDRVIE